MKPVAWVSQMSWAAPACGKQQTREETISTVADREGSRKRSRISGREHRNRSRKLSSRLGKLKGLEWQLRRVLG